MKTIPKQSQTNSHKSSSMLVACLVALVAFGVVTFLQLRTAPLFPEGTELALTSVTYYATEDAGEAVSVTAAQEETICALLQEQRKQKLIIAGSANKIEKQGWRMELTATDESGAESRWTVCLSLMNTAKEEGGGAYLIPDGDDLTDEIEALLG